MGIVEIIAIANLTWKGIALIAELRKEWGSGKVNGDSFRNAVNAVESAYNDFVKSFPEDSSVRNRKLEFDYARKAVDYVITDENLATFLAKSEALMAYINRQTDREYHNYLGRSAERIKQWQSDKANGKKNTLADVLKIVSVLLLVFFVAGCCPNAKPNSDGVIRADYVMLRYSAQGDWLDVEFDDSITSSAIRIDLGPPIALGIELPTQ
jgi:hypothetical protein